MYVLKDIVVYLLLLRGCFCFVDPDLVSDFLNKKLLNVGVMVTCLKKSEQVKVWSTLTTKNKYFKMVNFGGNVKSFLDNSKGNHMGVIIEADCESVEDFLIESGKLNYFSTKHHWLLLYSSEDVEKLFRKVNITVNADILIASPVNLKNFQKLKIKDFYSPASEQKAKFINTQIGTYKKNGGLDLAVQEGKFWRRRNMTGVTFNVMFVWPKALKWNLENYVYSDEHREIGTFGREHNSIMHICKSYYNYSQNLLIGDSWGYRDANGHWDGLIEAFRLKQLDFSHVAEFVRPDRAQHVDYGRSTWTLRTAFIFRNPKPKTSAKVFLEPLSTYTWIFTILLGVIGGVMLKYSLQSENMVYKDYNLDSSWGALIIYVIAALTQQDFPRTPRSISGRIITFFLFILFLLMYQFYSGSIVSILLNKMVTTVKTVRDLADSDLEAACEDIPYTKDFFAYSKDTDVQNLYRKKIIHKNNVSNYVTIEKGIKLVKKGGYAFHTEMNTAYPFIEKQFTMREICELRQVEMIRTQKLYNIVQKKSPYREMIEVCLQKLGTDGILHREITHWESRKPTCIESGSSRIFNVGIDDVYPAFMILAIGIVLSLIMLLIEIQIHLRQLRVDKAFENVAIYQFRN